MQNLPNRYRDWLTKEVNYIITEEEAQAFVRLSTDTERDVFIQRFWNIRNPEPNSPTNRYRDEIYQRIAYANQWFGHEGGTPGWMTDMGRVYITLGAPRQRNRLLLSANERPMEIWFYDNSNGALPPFFYVIFYQKDSASDFALYSPYMDGPEKLVTSYQAESGRVEAWKLIDHDLGREVARTTLSLIPSEPVDTDNATSSLQSDVLLATIRGLKDNPWTKAQLEQRRRLLEDVTHSIILADEFLYVQMTTLRDELGIPNVHYLLRLKRPEDFAVAQDSESKWYYAASVTVRVSTSDKKLIFTQQRELSHFLSAAELDRVKSKVFGFEGVLPLPPGKYFVELILANKLKKTAYRAEKELVVPEMPQNGLRVSDVVPFENAVARANGVPWQPFEVANVKFTPSVAQDLNLVQGHDLKFFYQIWTPPAELQNHAGYKLRIEYVYGRLGMGDTKTIVDEVEKSQFSSAGSMVNGKKIATADLPPGSYRLGITVIDDATHAKAYAALVFRIVPTVETDAAWDVVDPDFAEALRKGGFDYERAQCYLSAGDAASGASWLEKGFQRDPSDEDMRARLVETLFSLKGFKQIVATYDQSGISAKTDEQTILHIAESFDQLGKTEKSVEVLESAVNLKPKSGPLYLSLANYYQRLGNAEKAGEMERKGRSLLVQVTAQAAR
jgi:GWxTD domain-containing protein